MKTDDVGLTAIFAVLPLVVLFVLLGGFRMKAQWASLITLAVSIVIAITVYSMPIGQAGDAALEGAVFGFFPIMWIVINAIWVYNLTVETGHFDVLRRSFASISDDQRIQAVIIAFCFGALMEALAGFGTPVAISSVMLIALGFRPLKAATVALVANTAPVAFGALAVPITTLATVTKLPVGDLGAMVGRQTPILAVFVPLALVFIVDGKRGLRQVWPAALVCGATFGASSQYPRVQFLVRSPWPTSSRRSLRRWPSWPSPASGTRRRDTPKQPVMRPRARTPARRRGHVSGDPREGYRPRPPRPPRPRTTPARRRGPPHRPAMSTRPPPYLIIIVIFVVAAVPGRPPA